MSRIQEILAKADREGTTRRVPAAASPAPTVVSGAVAQAVDGSAALEPTPFVAPAAHSAARAESRVEMRIAQATLHPALVAAIAPHSSAAEQYRAIRTRLTQREESGPLRAVAVTSPSSGDGKSVTAANLALTMAQEYQRRVILIDADLRDPAVHALFAIERGPGLSEVLTGEASLDDALVHLPDFRLTLLPAGGVPDYPTELLGSHAMRRALDALRTRFDRILLDLPPVTPLADARAVAPFVDGALMVVRAGLTQRPALDQALAAFDEDAIIGLVLNDAT
jgi:capsular exopolysaccharide synthesis family protein